MKCSACMFKCTIFNCRHPSISMLTVTDVQQKWGKVAEKVASDMYKVSRLSEFCSKQSTEEPTVIQLTEETRTLSSFLDAFPESSLAYEMNGRPGKRDVVEKLDDSSRVLHEFFDMTLTSRASSTESLISVEDDIVSCELKKFLKNAFHPDHLLSIEFDVMDFIGPLENYLSVYYEVHVRVSERESIQICIDTIEQNASTMWKDERSLRITSSNAYSLYTYYSCRSDKPKDWKRKIMNIVIPREFQTTATMHGIRSELPAINAYMRDFGKVVVRCGLVVHPNIPWLGGSPDGIVINENKIIEVKCPEVGKNVPLEDMIPSLKYLTTTQRLLKKNHQYYAQVQMNMLILKCKQTDFIIYSAYEDKCYVQTIHFDEMFMRDVLYSLKEVYFNAFLKYLYSSRFKG